MSARHLLFAALLAGPWACGTAEIPPAPAPAPALAPTPAPAASPLAAMTPIHAPPWHGVVVEQLAAGSYTYLRVQDDAQARWVAVLGPGRSPGDRVVVETMGIGRDFHSNRLGRDFDELHFATVHDDPS